MPFPHSLIPKKHEICTVKGCGKPTNGKQYCGAHINIAARRKLPSNLRTSIRSLCCDAKCKSGAVHENGEQYCMQCKEACCWKNAKAVRA